MRVQRGRLESARNAAWREFGRRFWPAFVLGPPLFYAALIGGLVWLARHGVASASGLVSYGLAGCGGGLLAVAGFLRLNDRGSHPGRITAIVVVAVALLAVGLGGLGVR